MAEPQYLYKILDHAPPDPLPETLEPTALDARDGFIHLSIAKQTPLTASMFFGQALELWILKVDRHRLDGEIEWFTEPTFQIPNGCPHLHRSARGLGRENIVDVLHIARQTLGQDWAETDGMKQL